MYTEPKVYAVKHKKEQVIMSSRSGGIFTALSDYVFSKEGIVYGCVITKDKKAAHIRAVSPKRRDRMRGSKYIQSNLTNVFQKVKQDLQDEKMVLFSGTSCQIAGLKSFLGKDYEKLLCVDILCHGVGSSRVWRKYVRWQEKKQNKTCVRFDFRNKIDFGWQPHVETLHMQDEAGEASVVHSRIFSKLYQKNIMLRPSCYHCPYKSMMHPADITIGDFWKIHQVCPEFDDQKGVSLVMINNDKGLEYFHHVTSDLLYREAYVESSMQRPLYSSYTEPENRDDFWEDFWNLSFDRVIRKYVPKKEYVILPKQEMDLEQSEETNEEPKEKPEELTLEDTGAAGNVPADPVPVEEIAEATSDKKSRFPFVHFMNHIFKKR